MVYLEKVHVFPHGHQQIGACASFASVEVLDSQLCSLLSEQRSSRKVHLLVSTGVRRTYS